LATSLDLSGSDVQAVAIPAQGQQTAAGTPAIVTGWGATSVIFKLYFIFNVILSIIFFSFIDFL
jgi:hypothetical protein